jgi:hypothetical protein
MILNYLLCSDHLENCAHSYKSFCHTTRILFLLLRPEMRLFATIGGRSGHLSIFPVADVRELFGDDAHIRSIKVGLAACRKLGSS